MKPIIKNEKGRLWLLLPSDAEKAYSEEGAELAVLGEGVFLVLPKSRKEKMFELKKQTPDFQVEKGEEEALLSKLSRIRFEERIPESVHSSLTRPELGILKNLLREKIVIIFKSKKYPKGVYNISNKAFYSSSRKASPPSRPQGADRRGEGVSDGGSGNIGGGDDENKSKKALAINTYEHLENLGYMVLSNEYEAREMMPKIKEKLKGDDVKGVRGFDKNFYILRKSFLREYEKPVFALLDANICTASQMSKNLNLNPEAVTVLLMIMADEGLAIEKRKGIWARA
ncbi:MAG: hypothetical protein ABIH83_04550 [Candidatus Micrarchaeota archaeon]